VAEDKNSAKVQIIVAVIGLVGVLGTAIFSHWDMIVRNTENSIPKPEGKNDTTETRDIVSGRYAIDKNNNRIIVISKSGSNKFRIEEITGRWRWTGYVKLDGSMFSGKVYYRRSQATMEVIGSLRGDRSIDVTYRFLTKRDGTLADGRVVRHIWFPE
jgi:hypothetical protein